MLNDRASENDLQEAVVDNMVIEAQVLRAEAPRLPILDQRCFTLRAVPFENPVEVVYDICHAVKARAQDYHNRLDVQGRSLVRSVERFEVFGHPGTKRGNLLTQFLDKTEGLTRPGRGVYEPRKSQRPDSRAGP